MRLTHFPWCVAAVYAVQWQQRLQRLEYRVFRKLRAVYAIQLQTKWTNCTWPATARVDGLSSSAA